MTEYLLFTVHSPLVSWGEIAVGESRGSWDRPSRSAVLGLIAAALGLLRQDQAAHDALDRGYGVAVRLDSAGTPVVDYHTAQTLAASKARSLGPATRARLLAGGELETILSRRTYRQNALATVAVWAREQARWSLDDLAAALRRPTFTLYAGRKASPLGLPLAPELIRSDTLADAFLQRGTTRGLNPDAPDSARETVDHVFTRLQPAAGWGREVAHDPADDVETGLRPARVEVRRDTGPHRGRWHFMERAVEIGLLPEPPHSSGAGT